MSCSGSRPSRAAPSLSASTSIAASATASSSRASRITRSTAGRTWSAVSPTSRATTRAIRLGSTPSIRIPTGAFVTMCGQYAWAAARARRVPPSGEGAWLPQSCTRWRGSLPCPAMGFPGRIAQIRDWPARCADGRSPPTSDPTGASLPVNPAAYPSGCQAPPDTAGMTWTVADALTGVVRSAGLAVDEDVDVRPKPRPSSTSRSRSPGTPTSSATRTSATVAPATSCRRSTPGNSASSEPRQQDGGHRRASVAEDHGLDRPDLGQVRR